MNARNIYAQHLAQTCADPALADSVTVSTYEPGSDDLEDPVLSDVLHLL